MKPFRKLIDWLSLEDYEQASRRAATTVAARFSRGNVSLQNHRFVDAKGLDKLRAEGARARARVLG